MKPLYGTFLAVTHGPKLGATGTSSIPTTNTHACIPFSNYLWHYTIYKKTP